MSKFVHLHLHTEYSLLEGYGKIDDLIDKTIEYGMDSVAVTDNGSMFGIIEFYKKAKSKNIKPIIGCEIYVSKDSYLLKTVDNKKWNRLVLLAENTEGYHNLMKIVSEGYVNGFYYRPRVDKEILKKYSEGIICLSSYKGSEINFYINNNDYELAKNTALEYEKIFGKNNFFLELQDHNLIEQKNINLYLSKISKELSIPLVATNDVYYIDKKDSKIHDIVLCIGNATTIKQEKRNKMPNDEFYFKSSEEMEEIFKNYPDALKNTLRIAQRCNVELEFHKMHLPFFNIEKDHYEYLSELVNSGLEKKYSKVTEELFERAKNELNIIRQMGFVDYFLIVWDFIRYAKQNDIPVGAGRGSAAGSLVSYALDITGVDPIKYDLLFERFLNPERVSMPDIDIDFCYERRDEVIQYVKKKYGEEKVAQIVTFGTMGAKNSIRDVGRVLDINYSVVDKIAKQISDGNTNLKYELEKNATFKKSYNANETNKKLIDYAIALEGMPRHTSTHAAGVVIAGESVDEFVPLCKNSDQNTTQYNMIELEELGLLKMDFLGLRTLTVIKDTVDLINKNYKIKIDIEKIDENDKNLLNLFKNASTVGIFQFESEGMRAFLKELKPDRFDDLVAANSLYRPGPMNEIHNYIRYRNYPDEIKYLDPSLEDILDVTYGTIVYQEQVMKIVQKLGGFSMGQADNLRRAMGKKKMSVMEENREYFINGKVENGEVVILGAVRKGIDSKVANKIFDLMIDFAKYAFNKSHSVAYTFVAIQTAWLKTYYPVEFMVSLLSSVMGRSDKISLYIKEARNMGIDILPPDINYSFRRFSVENGKIRMGLSSIKNVGYNFIDSLVEERQKNGNFINYEQFIERMVQTQISINKKAVESLIKAGALDGLGCYRSQMLETFIEIIRTKNNNIRKNIAGQNNFFEIMGDVQTQIIPKIDELSQNKILEYEKEVLGMYISSHPYLSYEKIALKYSDTTITDILNDEKKSYIDNKIVTIGGIVSKVKKNITKNNEEMVFLEIEDQYSAIDVVVFPRVYNKYKNILVKESPLLLRGTIQTGDIEDVKLILTEANKLDSNLVISNQKEYNNYEKSVDKSKTLYLQMDSKDKFIYESIKKFLMMNKGDSEVIIYFKDLKKSFKLKNIKVDINRKDFVKILKNILKEENVKF